MKNNEEIQNKLRGISENARKRLLLMCCFLIAVPALHAQAAPSATTRRAPTVNASNVAASLRSFGWAEGDPQLIARPGHRPDVVLRLRTTMPALRKSLHQHYVNQTPLSSGVRVLGYANTAWGEVHVLLGRSQTGQVVRFQPAGRVVLARLRQAPLKPRLARRSVR